MAIATYKTQRGADNYAASVEAEYKPLVSQAYAKLLPDHGEAGHTWGVEWVDCYGMKRLAAKRVGSKPRIWA